MSRLRTTAPSTPRCSTSASQVPPGRRPPRPAEQPDLRRPPTSRSRSAGTYAAPPPSTAGRNGPALRDSRRPDAASSDAGPRREPAPKPSAPPKQPTPLPAAAASGGSAASSIAARGVAALLDRRADLGWIKITKVDAEPDGERPTDTAGTTYLLVGSDSREGPDQGAEAATSAPATPAATAPTRSCCCTFPTATAPTCCCRSRATPTSTIPGHGRTRSTRPTPIGGPELLVETVEQNTDVRDRQLHRDRLRRASSTSSTRSAASPSARSRRSTTPRPAT